MRLTVDTSRTALAAVTPDLPTRGAEKLNGLQRTSVPVGLSLDGYLPLRVLSSYAGLSVRTLRGYLNHPAQPLPSYRIGGKILVRRCEYDAWARQFRIQRPAMNIDAVVEDVLKDLR